MRRAAQLFFLTLFLCHSIVAGAASVTCATMQAASAATAAAQPCHGTPEQGEMPVTGDAADHCVCSAACMGSALVAITYLSRIALPFATSFAAPDDAASSTDPAVLIKPPIA